jgi:hypothetical protein
MGKDQSSSPARSWKIKERHYTAIFGKKGENKMRVQDIQFASNQAVCAFPESMEDLPQAIDRLNIKDHYPVIVLIGGNIPKQHRSATHTGLRAVAKAAEETGALVISGGTDMGIMALIGQIKAENDYHFSLLGVTVEKLATWPDGPRSWKFLRWGNERWPLAKHYSYFILVPGKNFGDESPWIINIAAQLSQEKRSVTILVNGGAISSKDIQLSLDYDRPVVVLAGTGRLADELAVKPNKPEILKTVPALDEQAVIEAIQAFL